MAEEVKNGRLKSAAVNLARQLFLYGNGDGRPVADTNKLSALSGCHPRTIQAHFRGWEKEREEMLSEPSNNAFGLSVSPAVLSQHKETVQFLANQETELRAEVEAMPAILRELKSIIRSLSKSENYDDGIQAFKVFLRLYGNRRETVKLHLLVQARLRQHSGIELLEESARAREKTIAAGRARLDIARETKAAEMQSGSIPIHSSAAARDDAFADDDDGQAEECERIAE